MLCYNLSHIESCFNRIQWKKLKRLSFGKPGENPGRTRRCEWEQKPHNVTVLYENKYETAWEDAVIRMIHQPEYPLERDEQHFSERR